MVNSSFFAANKYLRCSENDENLHGSVPFMILGIDFMRFWHLNIHCTSSVVEFGAKGLIMPDN
jgi:hypothetical protein